MSMDGKLSSFITEGKGGSKGYHLPFRWGHGLRVMKNCEPFVFGPLFAIQSKLWAIESTARAESRNAKVCQIHEAKYESRG